MLSFARLRDVLRRSRWPADPRATLDCLSSDGVPPELEFLGLHDLLSESGLTGSRNRSDRFARGRPGVGRGNGRAAISSVLSHLCVNILFGDSAGED